MVRISKRLPRELAVSDIMDPTLDKIVGLRDGGDFRNDVELLEAVYPNSIRNHI